VLRCILEIVEILLPASDELGDEQIVNFEAQPFGSSRILVADDDEALLPALG
jgi:hypothetical protein